MKEKLRLGLALFRTSWIRSVSTIAGIAAITAMATSVLLVLHAFDDGIKAQLDAVFHERNRLVTTSTGAAMPPEQVRSILELEGVENALPVAQLDGSVQGERAVILVLPDEEAPADKPTVWLSTLLRENIGQEIGAQTQLRVGTATLELAIGPDPTAQGYPEFDQSAYAITLTSMLEEAGHLELGAPTVVLLNAPDKATQDRLNAYVADHPGLVLQDREAADTALRTGIQPLLQNLPLVAMVAFLLGLVLIFTIIRASADAQRVSLVLLRALGASSKGMRGLATVSALLHGAAGCALGLALAAPAASGLMGSIPASSRNSAAPVPTIPPAPAVYLSATAVVLVVCVIAARVGVRPILQLSAEDQFRGNPGVTGSGRVLPIVGLLALGASILMSRIDAQRLGSLALLLMLIGWAAMSPALVGALLKLCDRVALRTRPGFVSRSSDERVARQMRSGGVVTSGALVLLVSLTGLAANLEKSTEPTLAGMGDIDLMIQDVALDDLPTVRNLPGQAEASLAGIGGVTAVRPVQMGYVTFEETRVLVQGVQPGSMLPVVQQGRALGGELKPGQVYVSTQFAARQGVDAGDAITVVTPTGETVQFSVSAVVDSFLWPGGLLVMHVTDSHRLWPGEGVSAFEVMADGAWHEVRSEVLQRQAELQLPDTVLAASGPEQAAQAKRIVRDSSQLYQALALIGLFVAMLIAASAITLDTSTRLREFGTIRAIGGRSGFLGHMVVIRALLLVAPATVVGGAFGALLLWLTTEISATTQGVNLTMHFSWATFLAALVACALVVGVAALGSARMVMKKPAPKMLGAAE